MFNKKPSKPNDDEEQTATKEEQAIELMKDMTPAQLKIIEVLLNKPNPR